MTESEGTNNDSIRILQEDDGVIAGRETIPLSSISSVKERGKIYRVFARVVNVEESSIGLREQIRIRDETGETLYHPYIGYDEVIRKLKVGDMIDLIASCWIEEDGTVSLGFPILGRNAIKLLDSEEQI